MKQLWPIAFLFATPAMASDDTSWQELFKNARTACTREVVNPSLKVTGTAGSVLGIGFGKDADRYYALILTTLDGRTRAQSLCLYDKVTKKATAGEIGKD